MFWGISELFNLEVSGLRKTYPGVEALKRVDFKVEPGKVHALVGANGAGKSTLIKVLAGLENADSGLIQVKGKTVQISDPDDATAAGLAFIHQDLALFERLTIAENLQIMDIPSKLGFVQRNELLRRSQAVLDDCLPGLDPREKLRNLSVAQKWMLSIARMIMVEAHTIFLDEPTAALGRGEVEVLFASIRRIVAKGCSVVFVSHRLEEVLEISDTISAMVDGQIVETITAPLATKEKLVQLITGETALKSINSNHLKLRNGDRKVLVSLNDISNSALTNVNIDFFAGEVVGVAGLVGSGRSELLETIFGLRQIKSGKITIKNEELRLRGPVDAVKAGIALMPEDRKSMAMFPNRSVRINTTIVFLTKFKSWIPGFLNFGAEENATVLVTERLKVKATGSSQLVRELSGGNQQKVVVGRWLCGRPLLVMADEPTSGVDVGAKHEMLHELREIANEGNAVIVVSSEFSELALICDRVIVMRGGKIVEEFQAPIIEQKVLESCFGEVT